jgi:MraZ protein
MTGHYKSTVDAKGRMNIPAKLREALGDSFVIAKPLKEDTCLTVYTGESWKKLEEKFDSLPQFETDEIRSYLFGNAYPLDRDEQWRVLIPPSLREFAELSGEVVMVAERNTFGVWSKAEWDKKNSAVDIKALRQTAINLGI